MAKFIIPINNPGKYEDKNIALVGKQLATVNKALTTINREKDKAMTIETKTNNNNYSRYRQYMFQNPFVTAFHDKFSSISNFFRLLTTQPNPLGFCSV